MAEATNGSLNSHEWTPHPAAAALVQQLLEDICHRSPTTAQLARRMYTETGTRLFDWIDHLEVSETPELVRGLAACGFAQTEVAEQACWDHPGGLFPPIRLHGLPTSMVAVKVENVADFLAAHQIDDGVQVDGAPWSQMRRVKVAAENLTQLWVVERHGTRAWTPPEVEPEQSRWAQEFSELCRRRRRRFVNDEDGFRYTQELLQRGLETLGRDWTCDLFFAAEREYWQRRNRAARVQKSRQDLLGLGWANHDHHTYRSSRENFVFLIALLEQLGFHCRERFYGGHGAGWGAQVLEQPICGLTIFADVDMSPEEVTGDFAHVPLPAAKKLGTVGLWCKLHGEAFLQAGLHHLECQFDFEAARTQLLAKGIASMAPFTDFDHLRQAFTTGEMWSVDPQRIERLLAEGWITHEQAQQFQRAGAVGSHLEVLQRSGGYKGFNMTGISEIIQATDPRRLQMT